MPKQKIHEDITEPANDAGAAMISSIALRDLDSLRAVIDAIPGVEVRVESVDEISEFDRQTENLIRWQLSEWPQTWVDERDRQWNHEDWMELVAALANTEYWPMHPEGIGRVLEEEAGKLNQQAENLNRWKNSGLPQEWVAARNGEWNHDDWTNLIGDLAGTEFWPMKAERIGQVLEELKGAIEVGEVAVIEVPSQIDQEIDDTINYEAENLARWLDSGLPQTWVEERHGDWGHDDWTNLVTCLAETEFWPMQLTEIGRILEELKGSHTVSDTPEVAVQEGPENATTEAIQVLIGHDQAELTNPSDCDREATVRLLVARGADVNAKDGFGQTPLHQAAFEGREEIVRVLLSNGADVHAATNAGRTALHLAVAGHHQSVINLLLACGAQINVADESGVTPLHLAILDEEDNHVLLRRAETMQGILSSTPTTVLDFPNGDLSVEQGFSFQTKNGKAGDELG